MGIYILLTEQTPIMEKTTPIKAKKNEKLLMMGIHELAMARMPNTRPTIAVADISTGAADGDPPCVSGVFSFIKNPPCISAFVRISWDYFKEMKT